MPTRTSDLRKTMNKPFPELLSPAGSYEVMKACYSAGADAVYMGLDRFSARAYADNAGPETYIRAIRYAHLHGKKLYLTLNTLLRDSEIEQELYELIRPLYEEGLDAVIVQDGGVLHFLREFFPGLPLHASTQMTAADPWTAKLLSDFGLKRIIPARELSLPELREMQEMSGLEIECFIHGALCYSYSGQCLMSSLAGGRSGNRGRCAQPCRQPYNLFDSRGRKLNRDSETYLLSLKDLCSLDSLPELVSAGIASLNIEGRMKKAEYAAGVTSVYRKYLDLFQLDENKTPLELSEGMKVKVNLLLALSHRAGMMMLDEPTSGLDPFSRSEPLDVFSGLKKEGVAVFYTSVYGNTKGAAELLASKLKENGAPSVALTDLARSDMAKAVADAFAYHKVVFATTTYNAEIFPFMKEFITQLVERNFQKKTVAFIENGSWAPQATKVMKTMLEKCKDLTFCEKTVRIMSGVSKENKDQIDELAKELSKEYIASGEKADKNDLKALFKIGYGLYVVTVKDGDKDNGLIVNTVTQVTNTPNRIAVCVNKQNYSHHIIKKTGVMNVNCLSVEAPFSVFEKFGFVSGRTDDKFAGDELVRSENGIVFLQQYTNAMMSLKVTDYVDLDTHGMFICEVTEARVLSDKPTMTYDYYQSNVKPKPQTEGKKGYVCKVCGYVHEGDLPEDFVCPLCKHGVADFEPIG